MFDGQNLQDISIEERARKGIFFSFSIPFRNPWCEHK